MKKYAGKLNDWSFEYIGVTSLLPGQDNFKIRGRIEKDELGRFRDGEFIYTSLVVKYNKEKGEIETLNSIYSLGKPHDKTQLDDLLGAAG